MMNVVSLGLKATIARQTILTWMLNTYIPTPESALTAIIAMIQESIENPAIANNATPGPT